MALTTQGGAARARRPEPGGPGRPEPRLQRLRTRWARAGARRAERGLGGARLLWGTSEPPGSVHRPSRLPADEPPPGRAARRDGAQWDITSRTPCCHPEAQAPRHLGERGAGEAPGPPVAGLRGVNRPRCSQFAVDSAGAFVRGALLTLAWNGGPRPKSHALSSSCRSLFHFFPSCRTSPAVILQISRSLIPTWGRE